MPDNIPIEWIHHMIDQLLIAAKKLPENDVMRTACLVRAEYAMDLLKSWDDKVSRGTC